MSSYLRDVQYATPNNLEARIALHERFSTNSYGWHRWVHDRLQLFDGARVLELGCGTGLLWRDQPQLPKCDVVLTDFSKGMLQTARENTAQSWSLRFALADAQVLPFRSGAFDVVIADHMLYHVDDKPAGFEEICRVLKPNGSLYAATNGPSHFKQIEDLHRRFAPRARSPVVSESFDLANGPKQLAPFFSQVDVTEYPDSLEVTEFQPLIDYIVSMNRSGDVTESELGEMTRFLQDHISEHDSFHIDKQAGMITARRT